MYSLNTHSAWNWDLEEWSYWESQVLGRWIRSLGPQRKRKKSGDIKKDIGVWSSPGEEKDKHFFFKPRDDDCTTKLLILLKDMFFLKFCTNDSFQFSSVTQLSPTLCDPMNRSMPGIPVHHHFPEFTQTHAHWVGNAYQPSHPLSSPFPPAPNPSQHQSLFQWVNSSHEVAKVLEFQL